MDKAGEPLAPPPPGRPGVIIKLFGAILMMLGLLDSLLSLRGGMPAHEFLLLTFFGAAVFAVGAVRSAAARPNSADDMAPGNAESHNASP